MIQIAQDRIFHLFSLAEQESRRSLGNLPDRYVGLARRIGARYNVRLPKELGEQYCRGCSTFWVEGRNVRTRLRGGYRTRNCLVCGRIRRIPWRDLSRTPRPPVGNDSLDRGLPGMATAEVDFDGGEEEDDGSDEG